MRKRRTRYSERNTRYHSRKGQTFQQIILSIVALFLVVIFLVVLCTDPMGNNGRTAKCFAAYAEDMLKGKDNIRQNRIFITHSGIDPDIIELVRTKINEWQPDIENIYVTRAGGTISCHCGPGTLGVLFIAK